MSDPRAIRYEATSILELGAKGVLDGVPFTLVGRRCIRGHRGSVWNEWTLDGIPHATLAESAGRFTLYREGPLIASVSRLSPGERLPWIVIEHGTATCAAHWGEVAPAPESWEYADLSEIPSGRRATLSGGAAFLGHAFDPIACGLAIRREPPSLVPAPDVAMPGGLELWLEVGDKGMLDGVTWQVLGIVARRAMGANARWEEYCVYSAGVGLCWLVVADGRWSFVSPVEAGLVPVPDTQLRLAHERGSFDMPQVIWAAGELGWEVQVGESTASFEVDDLVGEQSKGDVTWSRQQPLETDTVARAFNKRAMPRPR